VSDIVRIGLAGLGVVGGGVLKLLEQLQAQDEPDADRDRDVCLELAFL